MVTRGLISYRYLLPRRSSRSASWGVTRGPLYSASFSRFLIGLVAKRPNPVNARPMRNGLRGISDLAITGGSMRMADETPRVNYAR